ncbi:hypothetical protein HK104_001525 [Borealophlyctis nickersoniae]|nr:hypothetical protein HK104_001525 [Borealophlyctis nickersoniae]
MQELRSSIPRSNSSTSTPIASSVSNVALALRSSTSKGPVGAAPSCAKPIAPENLTAPISPFAVRSTSTTTRSPFSPKEDVVDAPSISLWSGGTRKSIPGTSERIRKASNEEGTVGTVAERKGSQDGVVAPRPAPSGIVRADAVARPSTPGPPEMPSAAPLRALQSGIAKVGTVAASQPLADKPSIVLARRASSAAAVDSGIAKSVSVGGSQTLADAPPIVLTRRASSVAVPGLPMSGWEPDEDDFDSPHVSGELQPRFKGLGKRETKTGKKLTFMDCAFTSTKNLFLMATEDRRSPRSSKTGSADGLLKSDAPSNPIHRVFSAGTIAKSALLQPAVSTPAVGTPPPGSLQAAAQLTPGARSTTALSGPAPAKPSQQGSVPNIGEGGPSLGSMGSVGSNIGSLPEVTLSATSIRVQPKDEVMVEPFERSSSGLFNLEPGWENEEFEDPKYNVWRKAMLETLPLQIDYPLLLPPELVALVMEDFEAS